MLLVETQEMVNAIKTEKIVAKLEPTPVPVNPDLRVVKDWIEVKEFKLRLDGTGIETIGKDLLPTLKLRHN